MQIATRLHMFWSSLTIFDTMYINNYFVDICILWNLAETSHLQSGKGIRFLVSICSL
ncbi:hypothetical protein RchiOBHm_Chr7g0214831 [Rosa chinensis]|uniref:Uncharacterized protein n=1 Tax=Rosa chinensis TaxID=74649 RepID=A0A2P6PBB1_ROSCH|nr:hypothetical protein RchiOBHm_Chr7g0214831 [Rosa chinensis]